MKALGFIFLWCAVQNTGSKTTQGYISPVYQVIISEIMADPIPRVMLPEIEYIEIYNRGSTVVDMTGWKLIMGNHERILPSILMEPGEYRIICDTQDDSFFDGIGKTLPVSNMPALLNTGQVLTLKTSTDVIVHSLSFSDRWYKNNTKRTGGWSLEIIDPDNPCSGTENWSESLDVRGGSPGIINSVDAHNPDNKSPTLLRATLPSDSAILLHFSEPMAVVTLLSPGQYSVNQGLLHPADVYPVEPDFTSVLLKYPETFKPDYHYGVTILNTPEDCSGNRLTGNLMADFAISQLPRPFDVVFNEILFEPPDSLSSFIELYNRSHKVLDLSDLSLALADIQTGIVKNPVTFNKNPFILFPDGYLVLTKNARGLPANPLPPDPSVVIEQAGMFSLPVEEGVLVLMDTSLQTIDEFHYNRQMHTELLNNTSGVSLERVNPDNPSSDPDNWHSASTLSGYATPGIRNSQMTLPEDSWGEITLLPEVFSPDNDGVDDYVTLHLQLHEPGWKGTIRIFDARGRIVKILVNNSMLGTDVYITWDGKWAGEKPADMGNYVLYLEIFGPGGTVKKIKKVITLVRRLS